MRLPGALFIMCMALAAGCDTAADLGYTTEGFGNIRCELPAGLEPDDLVGDAREQWETGISPDRRCDGARDCPLGDDEEGCGAGGVDPGCDDDEFACSNGQCIHATLRCNGVASCEDGSDERGCAGGGCGFSCDDGARCFESNDVVCDGAPDCEDGSDEAECGTPCVGVTCDDGRCVESALVCDGNWDCSDGTDESAERCGCETHYCNGQCLDPSLVCNGIYNCPDFSDEGASLCGCEGYVCPGTDRCIFEFQVCNGESDCPDASDESDLACDIVPGETYACGLGEAVGTDVLCNGSRDCTSGFDEVLCHLGGPYGECGDGTRYDLVYHCDGQQHCDNGRDEAQCGPCGDFGGLSAYYVFFDDWAMQCVEDCRTPLPGLDYVCVEECLDRYFGEFCRSCVVDWLQCQQEACYEACFVMPSWGEVACADCSAQSGCDAQLSECAGLPRSGLPLNR